jgi:hypothetical protein
MDGSSLNGGLDLNDLAADDIAVLEVRHPATGEPTGWKITFAGPGHNKTTELRVRMRRKRRKEEMQKERAKQLGRSWADDNDETDADTLAWVIDRIIDWTPICINGQNYPFSRENAAALFSNPRHEKLYSQLVDFLLADDSFFKRSVTN